MRLGEIKLENNVVVLDNEAPAPVPANSEPFSLSHEETLASAQPETKKTKKHKKNKHSKKHSVAAADASVAAVTTPSTTVVLSEELAKHAARFALLTETRLRRSPAGSIIVVDQFYTDPMATRNYILTQPFTVKGNYPGQRTISYATQHLKEFIQRYVQPFGGTITDFPIPKADGSDAHLIYNGAFQYTTSRDRSWIHSDMHNNWAGVVYMTPNAPLSSGTCFYQFHDGTRSEHDSVLVGNKQETDAASQDMTRWVATDFVANVFNRLVLFDSKNYHMATDYFGSSVEDGRLFQVFFFSTER